MSFNDAIKIAVPSIWMLLLANLKAKEDLDSSYISEIISHFRYGKIHEPGAPSNLGQF